MHDLNDVDQVKVRKEKQGVIASMQKHAYPNMVSQPVPTAHVIAQYGETSAEELDANPVSVVIAGRIRFIRDFGKGAFWKCQDHSGELQVFLSQKDVSDQVFQLGKQIDLGDIVHVTGMLFRTRTGELTVRIHQLVVLAKCLRPLPEKFHGLTDVEICYRQRYLDLIVNRDHYAAFLDRSRMVSMIRRFFEERDYLEVETPILQVNATGALAKPFVTHHKTLGMNLFMRVAPELYLKRLVVGGYPRVFELGRNFRNEGISSLHNPEFTMLEFYQAYATHEDLMALIQNLVTMLTEQLCGGRTAAFGDHALIFEPPFARLHMFECLRDHFKADLDDFFDMKKVSAWAAASGIEVQSFYTAAEVAVILFEHLFEDQLKQPTFVTGFPVDVSPLARRSESDPRFADRFELYIGGYEVANGFSELNDPKDQLARFEAQQKSRTAGNEEAHPVDMDYIEALSYGMPPTAGAGIGVDRLAMIFLNQPSIRDVILFPTLRQ